MALHSSTLAWKIPWTKEPGRLQSMRLQRVGHDWVTSLSCIGKGNGNPLQCPCLENPRDGGAWWAAVYGVAQSRTRLKWPSSSSSEHLMNGSSLHLRLGHYQCTSAYTCDMVNINKTVLLYVIDSHWRLIGRIQSIYLLKWLQCVNWLSTQTGKYSYK